MSEQEYPQNTLAIMVVRYRVVLIGTQDWLAENLCETKYRNGELIPEVTDDIDWAALTTGALCAYDNDWDNAFVKQR